MLDFLTPGEYYEATLSKSGISRIDEEELTKQAAVELKLPLEQVKLAKAYYEELQKDDNLRVAHGIDPAFPDPSAREAAAYKMAAAFVAHRDSVQEKAASIVDRLVEKLAAVSAEYIADLKLEGITPAQMIKAAALQLETAAAFDQEMADRAVEESSKVASFVKVANPPFNPQDFYLTDQHAPQNLDITKVKQLIGGGLAQKLQQPLPIPQGEGADPAGYAARTIQHADAHLGDMGLADEAAQRAHLHNTLVNAHGAGHADLLRASGEVHAARTAPKPSWFSTPAAKRMGMAGAAGLVGAGAIGLINHFNQNRAAAAEKQQTDALKATASLPAN